MKEKGPQPINRNLQASFFDPRELGESLSEVLVDIIKSEDRNITSRWFHSTKDVDFFIWRDEQKNIIKQQICFLGSIVEWNIVEGVRTGCVLDDSRIEEENSGAMGDDRKMKTSSFIQYDNSPNQHCVDQGVSVISHIKGLLDSDKQALMQNFSKAPRIASMTASDILAKFGLHKKSEPSESNWIVRTLKAIGFYRKS